MSDALEAWPGDVVSFVSFLPTSETNETTSPSDPQDLFADCGCTTTQCIQAKLADALGNANPVARLQQLCPGLDPDEATDAIAAAQHALGRQEHTPAAVALDVRGLACRDTFTVELYTTGPGQSTADVWRTKEGPHKMATQCDGPLALAMDNYAYDWTALQDELWDAITTPAATYAVAAGEALPLITVPAYGAVYVRIR